MAYHTKVSTIAVYTPEDAETHPRIRHGHTIKRIVEEDATATGAIKDTDSVSEESSGYGFDDKYPEEAEGGGPRNSTLLESRGSGRLGDADAHPWIRHGDTIEHIAWTEGDDTGTIVDI
ncbi:hypothetical protein FRC00_012996, partial [Tulasnella sp. 408]